MRLRKDVKQRVADIRDVRPALEGAFGTVGPQTTTTSDRGRLWMAAFAAAALVSIAMAVPALWYLREMPAPAPGETRLDIVTPATNQPLDFALSPDGRQIVFVAAGDGAALVGSVAGEDDRAVVGRYRDHRGSI